MRLIDADELIKEIQKSRENGFPANENLSIYAISCVNHAPTAYDKEKVVEQIANESYGMDLDESDYVIERDRAIETVEKGGIE